MIKDKSSLKRRIVTQCKQMIAVVLLPVAAFIDSVKWLVGNLSNRGFGALLLLAVISVGLVLSFCSCDNHPPKHPDPLIQAGLDAASGEVEMHD